MVRPSSAMNTASGAYKLIIALTLPELNRSTSVATMPSGSVGSEYDSDIRDLLFVLVETVALGVTLCACPIPTVSRLAPQARWSQRCCASRLRRHRRSRLPGLSDARPR